MSNSTQPDLSPFDPPVRAIAPGPPFSYVISGLTVQSEIELPSAIHAIAPPLTPEITIRSGVLPERLPGPARSGLDWQCSDDSFLLDVPTVARFLIRSGAEIVFSRHAGCDEGDLTLFLVGTCLAAVLQQRGRLVLHASAVAVNGKAMIFCGDSGAGKSTLAATLAARGYALMNDDVCSLSRTADGRYEVHPDGRLLKLWAASLDHLHAGQQRGPAVRRNAEKYYQAAGNTEHQARPLGGVFILQRMEQDEPASLHRMGTAQAMRELARNAYRPALVSVMHMDPAYFAASAALQQTVGLWTLSRQMTFAENDAAIKLLEQLWEGS